MLHSQELKYIGLKTKGWQGRQPFSPPLPESLEVGVSPVSGLWYLTSLSTEYGDTSNRAQRKSSSINVKVILWIWGLHMLVYQQTQKERGKEVNTAVSRISTTSKEQKSMVALEQSPGGAVLCFWAPW